MNSRQRDNVMDIFPNPGDMDCECRHPNHRRGCRYYHQQRFLEVNGLTSDRINGHNQQQPVIPPPHSPSVIQLHQQNHHQQLSHPNPHHHLNHNHRLHHHPGMDHPDIEELAQSEHYSTLPVNINQGTLRSVAVSSTSYSTSGSSAMSSLGQSTATKRIVDPVTQTEVKYSKSDAGCTPSTCVYLSVAFILITVGASSGLYFGYSSWVASRSDRVFKVRFTITQGEPYDPRFEMPSSDLFRETSIKYQVKLNKIFNTTTTPSSSIHFGRVTSGQRQSDNPVASSLTRLFRRSEVIALEKFKEGSDDVVLHANLHFLPFNAIRASVINDLSKTQPVDITAADVYLALANEISKGRNGLFSDVTIDQSSLDVMERRDESAMSSRLSLPFYPTSSISTAGISSNDERNSKSISSPSPSNDPSFFRSGYNYYRNPWEPRTRFPGVLEGLSTEPTPPIRRCQKIDLPWCSSVLPYNETSYPNILGHWNISSVEESFVTFRQVVDAECYPLAREYICRVLQPECVNNDQLVFPCRDFCSDFKRSCGQWIDRLDDKRRQLFDRMIKCPDYPRWDGDDGEDELNGNGGTTTTNRPLFSGDRVIFFDEDVERRNRLRSGHRLQLEKRRCRSKPGCPNELKMRGRSHHICDAVIDCPDSSDETSCDSCVSSLGTPSLLSSSSSKDGNIAIGLRTNSFYCGNKQCVDPRRVCDSIIDCVNGADEEQCMRLEPPVLLDPPFVIQNSGIVSTRIRGKEAKVCFESFENSSIPLHRKSFLTEKAAAVVCRSLGFRDVIKSDLKVDHDRRSLFVQVDEIITTSSTSGHFGQRIIRQSETPCNSRQVLHVSCGGLECGKNPLFTPPERRADQELSTSLRKLYEQFDRPIDVLPGSVFSANEGDFPWVVQLSRQGQYACDGTLIDDQWVLSSTSCFESNEGDGGRGWSSRSSSSSQWRVSLGSVRLTTKSPLYAQEKETVALLHSPFNDKISPLSGNNGQITFSGLSLLKLDSPVNVSNFIRPSCIHSNTITPSEIRKLQNSECYTTSWNVRKDRMEFVRVSIVEDKECDNLLLNTLESMVGGSTSTVSSGSSSSAESLTMTSPLFIKWKDVNWCIRVPLSGHRGQRSSSLNTSGSGQQITSSDMSLYPTGRGLYCLTSSSTFSLVGVEDNLVPVTGSTTTTTDSSNFLNNQGSGNRLARMMNNQIDHLTSSSIHLFSKTMRHTEWIRQILDSFKRSAATSIDEVTVETPFSGRGITNERNNGIYPPYSTTYYQSSASNPTGQLTLRNDGTIERSRNEQTTSQPLNNWPPDAL